MDLLRRDYGCTEGHGLRYPGLVYVRSHDPRTLFPQVSGVVIGHLPEALDCHGLPLQGVGARQSLQARPGPLIYAEPGDHLGAAQAAVGLGEPGGIQGLFPHVHHVLVDYADVLGGDVTAPHGVHEAAMGAEQGLGLVGGGIGDDDGLAAPVVEPRQ